MKIYKTPSGTYTGINEDLKYVLTFVKSANGLLTINLEEVPQDMIIDLLPLFEKENLVEIDLEKGELKIPKLNKVYESIKEIVDILEPTLPILDGGPQMK